MTLSHSSWFTTALLAICLVFITTGKCQAQSSGDRRIEKLVDQLENGGHFEQEEAAEKLLIVDPKRVDADLRKRIARAYRARALGASSNDQGPAVRGLVHWAGKYSVPVLVEVVSSTRLQIDDAVWDALVEFEDPRCVEAAASMLGNFFNHDEAVNCLSRMGASAETALINVAKNGEEKAAIAAVELLGEVGGKESLSTLRKVASRGSVESKAIARMSINRIKGRIKGESSSSTTGSDSDDPGDPFAENTAAETAMSSHPEEGDWSRTDTLLPRGPGRGFKPDSAPESDQKSKELRAASLKNRSRGPSRGAGLLTAVDHPTLAAFLTVDPFHDSLARIERVDLSRGKATGSAPLPRDTVAGALSPSGKLIAIAAEEGDHHDRLRIEINDLSPRYPELVDRWTPYTDDDKIFSTHFKWIAWINESEFFTLNRAGDLVLWKVEGAVAVWQAKVKARCRPALSPGRKQIAVSTPDGIALLECATGETLAWVNGPSPDNGSFAFDRRGERLVCVNGPRVRIWDLASESLISDFHLADLTRPGNDFIHPISWPSDEQIVIVGLGAVDVVDLQQRRILERYKHSADSGASLGAWSLLAYQGHSRSAIIPVEAPSPKLSTPDIADPDSLLALKPGASVSLDVRVGRGLDSEVRELLSNAIQEAGLREDPNAEIRFTARLGGENEVVTYRSFHSAPWDKNATTDVNVEKKVYSVTLFIEGDPAWTYRREQGAQMHLHSRRDETFQQASDRQTKESVNYFRGIELPRRIVHPSHAGPLVTHEVQFNQ